MIPARSFLYVPGDRPDRFAKALARGGDAIILDLEDAVAPANKEVALVHVAQWLREVEATARQPVWVRVNSGDQMSEEMMAVAGPALAGFVIPKANIETIRAAGEVAARAEADQNLAAGSFPLAGLVESARGVQEVAGIATAPGVSHLMIGEADLAAELGLSPSADERELIPLRLQLVVASAAAGLAPPTGPVHVDVRNLEALREGTETLRRLGFGARSAIHPDQVPVIESVFTPTPEEVDRARELVEAHDGRGGGLGADGRFVDEAVLRSARRIVALGEPPAS